MKPALTMPDWRQLHRLIPSHYPPISLFETIVDSDELDILFALEALTNDRLRQVVGAMHLVPSEERVSGPGSSPVMAAFTHVGVASRFTDGSYGVYYGANDLATAIAETVYHRELFLADTKEPDTELTMREYVGNVTLPLHDVRDADFKYLHVPDDYTETQAFARQLRGEGSNGLLYNSVRKPRGECVAAFRPKTISIPTQGGHFRYVWSGHLQKITAVLRVEEFTG